MRNATTQRSVGGFVAFVVGLVVTAVLLIAILAFVPMGSGEIGFPSPGPESPGGGGAAVAGASSAVAGSPASSSAVASSGGATAAPASSGGGGGATIAATEKDFAIALDKSSVPAGTITFNIKNNGPSPHNVGVVAGNGASKAQGITGQVIKDSETIDQGKTTTLTVDLQPGTYQVVCTVPGHVQLGMILQLTVQ